MNRFPCPTSPAPPSLVPGRSSGLPDRTDVVSLPRLPPLTPSTMWESWPLPFGDPALLHVTRLDVNLLSRDPYPSPTCPSPGSILLPPSRRSIDRVVLSHTPSVTLPPRFTHLTLYVDACGSTPVPRRNSRSHPDVLVVLEGPVRWVVGYIPRGSVPVRTHPRRVRHRPLPLPLLASRVSPP